MTDSVSRLKELLFDSEAATISELSTRITQIGEADRKSSNELAARIAQLERTGAQDKAAIEQTRLELNSRFNSLSGRVGTPEALQSSVAEVLDNAI